MIHHDGLMAVATVYPIAILLLAVEVRAMEPFLLRLAVHVYPGSGRPDEGSTARPRSRSTRP